MRVVIDTNILVSAVLWGGTPQQVFQEAMSGKLTFVTSEALIAELIDVLSRPKFVPDFEKIGMTVEGVVSLIRRLAEIVSPAQVEAVIAADPDDDAVLACAVVGRADAIVSGDNHLLALGQYRDIPILTASALLEHLAE